MLPTLAPWTSLRSVSGTSGRLVQPRLCKKATDLRAHASKSVSLTTGGMPGADACKGEFGGLDERCGVGDEPDPRSFGHSWTTSAGQGEPHWQTGPLIRLSHSQPPQV